MARPNGLHGRVAPLGKIWRNPRLVQRLTDSGRSLAAMISVRRMAEAHLLAFDEATRAFSRIRYVWHRWVYQHYDGARVHYKYRKVLAEDRT